MISKNKNQRVRGYLILAVFIFRLIFMPVTANAQGQTTIAVSPTENAVIVNNTKIITLTIADGVNVNAFDVEVKYDPTLLTVLSWEDAGYIGEPNSNFWYSDKPGTLRVAYTQLALPPVSGNGNLLNITFRGIAIGSSPISITFAGLYDPLGVETLAAVEHGTLRVHDDPAPLPKQTVSGSFSLQGRADTSGIPAALGFGQTHWLGPYAGLTANLPYANLTLADVVEDVYPLATAMPRCLNVTAELNKTMAVFAGHDAIAPLMLRCGNAVWQRQVEGQWLADNVIDVADINLIGLQYTQSGPDLDGDVNYSGRVDIFDLALAAGNYDLTSETAYAGWTP